MTTREEAERILSSANDDDLIEIDSRGNVYAAGTAPSVRPEKRIPGISDPKGEYGPR